MKQVRVLVVLLMMTAVLLALPVWPGSLASAAEKTQTAGSSESGDVNLTEMFAAVEETVSTALSKMDSEQVNEMFSFIKERFADGSLKTEDGLADAISEGEERFGVTVDQSTAAEVVATMEKLEDMGFSGTYIMEKAQGLYEKYGADFLQHADEAVTGAVQDAVVTAADGFLKSLWEGVKNFFGNLW